MTQTPNKTDSGLLGVRLAHFEIHFNPTDTIDIV
jgi:hypothetical protein